MFTTSTEPWKSTNLNEEQLINKLLEQYLTFILDYYYNNYHQQNSQNNNIYANPVSTNINPCSLKMENIPKYEDKTTTSSIFTKPSQKIKILLPRKTNIKPMKPIKSKIRPRFCKTYNKF